MLDMHCHILPGVDDGAPDKDEALRMLDAAAEGGIHRLICTPHLYSADADTKRIREQFDWLRPRAADRGIAAHLGFEIHYLVLAFASDVSAFCIQGTDALLLELPWDTPFPRWLTVLKELAERYCLIIAHPERCHYLRRQPDLVPTLRELGCEMQISADALLLPLHNPGRRTAQSLLDGGLANYIASDAHRARDYSAELPKMRARLHQCAGGRLDTL